MVVRCRDCGRAVPAAGRWCNACGAPLPRPRAIDARPHAWRAPGAVTVAVLLTTGLTGVATSPSPRPTAVDTVVALPAGDPPPPPPTAHHRRVPLGPPVAGAAVHAPSAYGRADVLCPDGQRRLVRRAQPGADQPRAIVAVGPLGCIVLGVGGATLP